MSESALTIRAFMAADQSAARALILGGLGEHWGYIDETLNPDLDDIAAAYPSHRADFLVVEDGSGRLIGTAGLVKEDEETGRVVRMSVDKSSRGRGIGTRLIAELETIARQRGYRRLVCETTHDWSDAIALYKATGFTELGVWDDDRHFEKRFETLRSTPWPGKGG